MIQSLIWDPVYLPWESEAFCGAVASKDECRKKVGSFYGVDGAR
ncbi:hypothetical protein [Sporolactobacillus terrae]|nr:hypothetical protein [Sporolactobacillus terrae]